MGNLKELMTVIQLCDGIQIWICVMVLDGLSNYKTLE
jgi:hypothetical protein